MSGGAGGGNRRFADYFSRRGVGGDGGFSARADGDFATAPSSGNRNRISRAIVPADFLEKRQHMLRTNGSPVGEAEVTFAIKRAAAMRGDETTVSHDVTSL